MELINLINEFISFNFLESVTNFLPQMKSIFTDELGIESDQSKQFSVGIFYFLVIGIIFFAIVAFAFMFKDKTKSIKKGEMILFIWIILGLVVAVIFGASQLLHGYLY